MNKWNYGNIIEEVKQKQYFKADKWKIINYLKK